jgi:hypothetical protein
MFSGTLRFASDIGLHHEYQFIRSWNGGRAAEKMGLKKKRPGF